jgi:hypothetical protein
LVFRFGTFQNRWEKLSFLNGPTFFAQLKNFCSVNFFPAKIFSGILKREIFLSKKKNLAGKKFTEQKRLSVFKSP